MKITSNKQELFNQVYTALVAQGKPAFSQEDARCMYLDKKTGRKCAIGHLIPDGHPAQEHNFAVRSLYYEHPELFENGTDIPFLVRLQEAHDNSALDPVSAPEWLSHFKKHMYLLANQYKLTVPECGPVSCAKPECEAC